LSESPTDILAHLLYRDGLILVIDKPAGLPVHAGPKGGPNLEDGFDALRFGLPQPPALAHRLDRDTSGCLVLGRHRKALARLGRLFSSGRVGKTYWAVVRGAPPDETGRIELPLAKRSTEKRGWWMKVDPTGQPAITDYRLRGRADGLAWLELEPRTGRTHQIRVHLAALGCPVLGDPIYGEPGPPLHLLARAVRLPLYERRPPVEVTAPVPAHMREALLRCGWRPEEGPPVPAGASA
jgi:tRNA pseudouridine32 synthase/23S rRNA pseudouridine746 synthase/23S rRNA pseudouridine1911/1915/1917 synthase